MIKKKTHRRHERKVTLAVVAVMGYLLVAYLFLPEIWRFHERGYLGSIPSLPKVTHNRLGIPGDPLNVGFVGTRKQLLNIMQVAGWCEAEPLTFRSSIGIGESVLLDRPDPQAPVSNLYLYGRAQDLAFEKEEGFSARRRQHVRWWQAPRASAGSPSFWVGSATDDIRAGLSRLTAEFTHHIGADVDAERDELVADMFGTGLLARQYRREGVGPTRDGRNAEGDHYHTDGMLHIVVAADTKTPDARASAPMLSPTQPCGRKIPEKKPARSTRNF